MKQPHLLTLLWLLTSMAGWYPALLPAQVSIGQVAPSQVNAVLNRSTQIMLRWSLTTDAGPFVRSQQGVLEDGAGNIYMTVSQPLSANATVGVDATGTVIPVRVSLGESLSIPSTVLSRAFQVGATRLFYRRAFFDGVSSALPENVSVAIDLTGAGGAGFALNYVGLRFDDNSIRRLVSPDSALRAHAIIRFTGNGQLRAVWEVADPDSSSGTPVFRPLHVVRQPLYGSQAVLVESPPLPVRRSGLYLLRLRIIEPALMQAPVVLQYFVSEASGRGATAIELLSPAADDLLDSRTVFRWRRVTGAVAYRLELYPQSSGQPSDTAPLTGMEVSADSNSLSLSPLVQRHLQAGEVYRWRLLALDADGRRVGQSEWRSLRSKLSAADVTGAGDAQ